jgi:hypothetical protein
MDHRLGQRVDMTLPVRLRFQDQTNHSGFTVNVGRGGMFVETRTPVPACGCVEVQIVLDLSAGCEDLLLSAFVVHRCENGLGLMFRDLDASNWQTIENLLLQFG